MRDNKGWVELPASAVAVGHCVIVNDMDRPSQKLVAVVVRVEGEWAYCKYINAAPYLDEYEKGGGIKSSAARGLTPVGQFGVRVFVDAHAGRYVTEVFGRSRAVYPDGRPRAWQCDEYDSFPARAGVAAVALEALASGGVS